MPVLKREAMYYQKLGSKTLRCELCPHFCEILDSEKGLCNSRQNESGLLYATNYGQTVALALDPIEKKPLYHYRPGSKILSLGPNSCNLSCKFCQNYQISQYESSTVALSLKALQECVEKYSPDLKQVAFTYTEPITWYEYIMDFAEAYPDHSIIMISNGFINPAPLAQLLPHISAMNIDLKGMQDSFYRDYCGGRLQPVINSIEACYQANVHLEITFLVIPGLNDKEADIQAMASFIAGIDPEIPLHVSAYHPSFKMTNTASGIEDIHRAVSIAREKLVYVYGGNILGDDLQQTVCKNCGATVISRTYAGIKSRVSANGLCPQCQNRVFGVYGA